MYCAGVVSAAAADSTLVIESSAIEKSLRQQLFRDDGRLELANMGACNESWLESPKVTASGGRLQIGVLFNARVGTEFGGECVGSADTLNVTASGKPFYREGRLGLQDIRIDSLSNEMYRALLQPLVALMLPKALDIDLKRTVNEMMAGRTAPYEIEVNEIVAREVTAEGNRLIVRLDFSARVR
jgi:hypothetical protein